MKLTGTDIGWDREDMTPPDDDVPDWLIDLSTELAEEIHAPHWCADLDADRKLRAYFKGDWERYDDKTIARLCDLTNWVLDNDYNRDEEAVA